MGCRLEGKLNREVYNKKELPHSDESQYFDEVESIAGRVCDEEYEVKDVEVRTPHVASSKNYNTTRGGSRKLYDAEVVGNDSPSEFQRITWRGVRTRLKEHQTPAVSSTPLSTTTPLSLVIISEFNSSERYPMSKRRGAPTKSEKDVEDSFLVLKVR